MEKTIFVLTIVRPDKAVGVPFVDTKSFSERWAVEDAILGEISISGTMIKVEELANALQVCLDSGAKKVLLPITSATDLGTVPSDLIGCFNLIFYNSAEAAVFKALGVD